jgi:hypothetical protein
MEIRVWRLEFTAQKRKVEMNTRSEKPSFSEIIWRRGELHYGSPLKPRNLLILRCSQYAKNAQSAKRRYTAGTRGTPSQTLMPVCSFPDLSS